MNANVSRAATALPTAELLADRGAFFGSILRTLNHLIIADTIWLRRFAKHPARYSYLGKMLLMPAPDTNADLDRFGDLASYAAHRAELDVLICQWAQTIQESDLSAPIAYTNSQGESFNKCFSDLLIHFFNHQTHHRGQVTTLLSQQGVDVGLTDLVALVPNQAGA